jgi:hypothetical protein
MQQCPLCREQSANWPTPSTFTLDVRCRYCGDFRITTVAFDSLRDTEALAFDIACWVHEQNQLGTTPTIDGESLKFIQTYPRPNMKKRAELYLGKAIKLLDNRLIGRIRIGDPALRVASWSFSREDLPALANYLRSLGALEETNSSEEYRLLVKAHIIYEEMAGERAASAQAFVAMWFDPGMKPAYDNGFEVAISGSGYSPLRIDQKEHDKKIDDQIIAEIRRSAFVVADFTEHRGGVYYEAGFAHGLGRHVIFTCKADHLSALHFDVRKYNTIMWNTPEDIVAPLQNRILALFGAGPLKPDAKPIPV